MAGSGRADAARAAARLGVELAPGEFHPSLAGAHPKVDGFRHSRASQSGIDW
jgi:hypothetical protein